MSALFATEATPKKRILRLFAVFALVGAGFSLALLAARMMSAISLNEPLQLQTTGDEFAIHFAIWRYIQGLPVYTDRFSPPFSYAVYNWLFYEFYGVVTGAVLNLLSLEDAWLSTVARFISLAAMVVGMPAAYMVFVRASESDDRTSKLICLAFAVFVVAGPLIGFWNITSRSDLWARTLEIIAVAVFLAKYPRRRLAAVLWFVVFAYLAWAFKQGNVFAAGGVGFFLLARRHWKPLALLSVLLPTLWGTTILLGEPQYLHNMLLKDFPLFISVDRLVVNVINFVVKSGPVLLFLPALAVAAFLSRVPFSAFWRRDAFVVGIGGGLCAAVLAFPASAQTGGAENYYFTLSFFLTLLTVTSLPVIVEAGETVMQRVLSVGIIGWATLIAAITLVFTGAFGVIDTRQQHRFNISAKRCLDTLPRPLFVNNALLSLPWMTPGNYPWVIAYDYPKDRKYGRSFKEGGIGGLIEKGRFKVVALTKDGATPPTEYDGGSLSGYLLMEDEAVIRRTCPEFFIFFRSPTN